MYFYAILRTIEGDEGLSSRSSIMENRVCKLLETPEDAIAFLQQVYDRCASDEGYRQGDYIYCRPEWKECPLWKKELSVHRLSVDDDLGGSHDDLVTFSIAYCEPLMTLAEREIDGLFV